jgi:anti-sigma factor RsiW
MTHFELEAWADFVRDVARPRDQRAMAEHLDTCPACVETVAWLRQVVTLASADEQYEPPAYALRHTRALFALERPRIVGRLPRLLGRLVFDSLAQPLPAGVRGPAGVSRQTVFEAGQYAVDLTLEQVQGAMQATLVGQVVSREPKRPIAAVPVFLIAGRTIVARTVSDAFGEFLLEYVPRNELRLQITVDEGERRIDIDVGDRRAAGKLPDRISSRRRHGPRRTGRTKSAR